MHCMRGFVCKVIHLSYIYNKVSSGFPQQVASMVGIFLTSFVHKIIQALDLTITSIRKLYLHLAWQHKCGSVSQYFYLFFLHMSAVPSGHRYTSVWAWFCSLSISHDIQHRLQRIWTHHRICHAPWWVVNTTIQQLLNLHKVHNSNCTSERLGNWLPETGSKMAS